MESVIIEDMYTPQAHFICDRDKNFSCPRVKMNVPCGDCKGTKHVEFAKIFYDEDKNLG